MRDLREDFLIFEEEGSSFIFDGGSGKILKVSEIIKNIFQLTKQYIIHNVYEYETLINQLHKKFTHEEINEGLKYVKMFKDKGFFDKNKTIYKSYDNEINMSEKKSYKGGLWLNLSHDCNLNCVYCYADGGSYGNDKLIMSKETAGVCIDYWFDKIDKNKKSFDIIFFGGEPLYNQETLYFSVDKINTLLNSIGAKARYIMATNGTIINEKILKLFEDNNFRLSVSIDGLEHMHNRNRPYNSGKNSYDDVIKNIKKMQPKVSRLITNTVVIKRDIPFIKEAVEHLWDNGVCYVNVALCISKNEKLEYEDLEEYHKQIKRLCDITYQNIIKGKKQYLNNLIESINVLEGEKELATCSLFNNGVFVFAPNGDAYKCHRNVGEEKYKINNIYNDNVNLLQYRLKKEKIEKCINCWAQILCDDGCPYEHEIFTGNINMPSQEWCNKTKIMQKETLRIYAKLFMNKSSKNKKLVKDE